MQDTVVERKGQECIANSINKNNRGIRWNNEPYLSRGRRRAGEVMGSCLHSEA